MNDSMQSVVKDIIKKLDGDLLKIDGIDNEIHKVSLDSFDRDDKVVIKQDHND